LIENKKSKIFQFISNSLTGFDPVIGKTVSAKYAGNLYHEVQHDNGDRYVVSFRVFFASEFIEIF